MGNIDEEIKKKVDEIFKAERWRRQRVWSISFTKKTIMIYLAIDGNE